MQTSFFQSILMFHHYMQCNLTHVSYNSTTFHQKPSQHSCTQNNGCICDIDCMYIFCKTSFT